VKDEMSETKNEDLDEPIARGSNLWKKKNVTLSGERIAKVSRVAAQVMLVHTINFEPCLQFLCTLHISQVAKLAVEMKSASVPVFPLPRPSYTRCPNITSSRFTA
jgi:hypothetical protein